MAFLDPFDLDERSRLIALAQPVRLHRGDVLIRRNDVGSDLYLVEDGALEVVDTRVHPELVIDVVGAGGLVGEVSFVDGLPRAADVRAASETSLFQWTQAALRPALEADGRMAARFYQALAVAVAARARAFTQTAVTGGLGRPKERAQVGEADRERVQSLVVAVRDQWFQAELLLRKQPTSVEVREQVHRTLARLVLDLDNWMSALAPERAIEVGALVEQELHAVLTRSRLGELMLESGLMPAAAPVTAHVLRGTADGDGPLGQALDAAILKLPTCEALRRRAELVAQAAVDLLPEQAPSVLLVGTSGMDILPRIVAAVRERGVVVTCVEQSREALAQLDQAVLGRNDRVDLRLVRQDLAALVAGRSSLRIEPVDLVVVDGLAEYVPDRLLMSLFLWCRGLLSERGWVLCTAMAQSPDSGLFDHILRWPMVRRAPGDLERMFRAAGFHQVQQHEAWGDRHPGLVVGASVTVGVAGKPPGA